MVECGNKRKRSVDSQVNRRKALSLIISPSCGEMYGQQKQRLKQLFGYDVNLQAKPEDIFTTSSRLNFFGLLKVAVFFLGVK